MRAALMITRRSFLPFPSGRCPAPAGLMAVPVMGDCLAGRGGATTSTYDHLMADPDALAKQLRDCSLEDLLVLCMRQYSPDGTFPLFVAAVEVRSAMESAKAAKASAETAKWTRLLAFATFALALGTVALGIVTAVR
jgi:hypothetical protein